MKSLVDRYFNTDLDRNNDEFVGFDGRDIEEAIHRSRVCKRRLVELGTPIE